MSERERMEWIERARTNLIEIRAAAWKLLRRPRENFTADGLNFLHATIANITALLGDGGIDE